MKIFDEVARPDLRTIGDVLGAAPRGFDAEMTAALTAALAHIDTAPQSIGAADRAQQQLIDVFVAHGHRAAAFLKVYHGITVAVTHAIADGRLTPKFFFERLPGRFAERHFDGVKAELGLDTTSDAAVYELWRPSLALDNLESSPDPALALRPPLAHFTVGMCCHINLDLAVALEETMRELGVTGDANAKLIEEIERGHNFVDSILEEKVAGSTELLAEELDCPMSKRILDARAVPEVAAQSMATIRRWRGKTFPNALRLAAAESDEARRRIREEVYRSGARKTVTLFNALPAMIEGTMRGAWFAAASG